LKNLLIITGPQGSGNHLWSKVFAANKELYGWAALNDTYWVPHDQEPFAIAWHDPVQLANIDIGNYTTAVTSISCPYAYHGVTTEPNYQAFINEAKTQGYTVKVAIIGRDQTVLHYQQERVRGTHSYHRFEQHLGYLCNLGPIFLSTELLYLYGIHYVRSLQTQLGFDINISQDQLNQILAEDPNKKYFVAATEQPLDKYVRQVSGLNTQ
jgi:hypothetical protein